MRQWENLNQSEKKNINTFIILMIVFLVGGLLGAGFHTLSRMNRQDKKDAQAVEATSEDSDSVEDIDKAAVADDKNDGDNDNKDDQASNEDDSTDGDPSGHKEGDEQSISAVRGPQKLAVDGVLTRGNNVYHADVYRYMDEEASDSYFDTALFIGDSRTEAFTLYTGQGRYASLYSETMDLDRVYMEKSIMEDGKKVTVAEAMKKNYYNNVYLAFGMNELEWNDAAEFVEAYSLFIQDVREAQPDAIIYVVSILPVSKERSAEGDSINNDRVNWYNEALKALCIEQKDVIYLDVAYVMKDSSGYLPEEASTDGVHPNAAYCNLWQGYIRDNVFEKR